MVNLVLEFKCCADTCQKEYDFIVNNEKYCMEHCPNKDYEIKIKKLCKYCDIEQLSNYVCNNCKQLSNKKEWAIVRHVKKNIDTQFVHNSNEPVNECSKRRPDVFFNLVKHCVIVEIDENQHKSYGDSCECARINEIVSSIGGKPVTFIRFNPDTVNHNGKNINVDLASRLPLLIQTIKAELIKPKTFQVKLIQLYFDDDNETFCPYKYDNITRQVAI